MNLLEYQGRQLFERVGLPVPPGRLASSPAEAKQLAREFGPSVAVKAQVDAGGRGKAGGIAIARSPDEAESEASRILQLKIQDQPVSRVLVTRAVGIEREYYMSITVDRSKRRPILVFSTQGGVDIEEVAARSPESIHRCHLSSVEGLHPYQLRQLFFGSDAPREQIAALLRIGDQLYQAFSRYRANLVEINPLASTPEGEFWALDSKLILDDDDPPEDLPEGHGETADPLEREAQEADLQYVKLGGNIGIIGNGAGLVMSTLDVVALKGGTPANFLDVGGGASEEQMRTALRLVTSESNVGGVFINIFGGITRCDLVARGILAAAETLHIDVPIVVRLVGTNEAEGQRILAGAGEFRTASGMEEGAEEIVRLVRS